MLWALCCGFLPTPVFEAEDNSGNMGNKKNYKNIANECIDMQNKYKYQAWKKVVEEDKLTPQDAQKKYVALVEKLKGIYGFEG